MNLGEKYTVNIEKLTNLGVGLAKIDGFVVFVEGACPEDVLEIEISKLNKNFANGKIINIIAPSKYRTDGFCPMQRVCGACQIQFIDYDYQLELKREIVKDAINKIGGLSIEIPLTIRSPQIKGYRHKIQYPVSQTKNSKRVLAGYFKPSTHEIVNIKYCPIQPQICDKIVEFIRNNLNDFKISAYDEKNNSGGLRHIVIRNSLKTGENLVTLVFNDNKATESVKLFCKKIYSEFADVSGVCVNFNSKKTNVIMGNETICIVGEPYIKEQLLDKTFFIGAETFFQVNPSSANNIFKYVKNYIGTNFKSPMLLDAYAGISTFGICMADISKEVVCVEENAKSTELAKLSAEFNGVNNIEINNMDAGKFFQNEKRKFDVVILDPPRKGCSEISLDNAYRVCKDTIIYVSCNPATLARDLKYLSKKGAKILSIQPFDMFCHSYHVENVAIIKIN